jgi:DNA phosphorothioation-associated putative methyltransferase
MQVRRERTAIARSDLSRPVQLLIGNGVLTPGQTFFDYGCGLGDDVRFLQSLGYGAHGWDPAYQPDEAPRNAAVVNLGYVLNVIERPAERADALRRAFELSQTCLCVAVLVGSAAYAGEAQSYGDGVLPSLAPSE